MLKLLTLENSQDSEFFKMIFSKYHDIGYQSMAWSQHKFYTWRSHYGVKTTSQGRNAYYNACLLYYNGCLLYIYFTTLVMGGGSNAIWMMNIHYHAIKWWEPQKKNSQIFQNPTIWIIWSRTVHLPEFFLLWILFWNIPFSCQTPVLAVFPCYTYMLLTFFLFSMWKCWDS